MQPEDETLVKGLRAWTVTVDRGSAPALTRRLAESSAEGHVLVVKAEMVFGLDHLRSALHHAARATRDGRNASDSLAMETLLYASGERQLSAAIKKMSPDETTEQIVVASLHEDALEPMPDWDRLPQRPGKDAREPCIHCCDVQYHGADTAADAAGGAAEHHRPAGPPQGP
ncbi:MAG: hypothetical protein MUC90_03600, partial [Thermoplasmata archaeon]|nr:hypothetical protein [Thermoplasmata archaeon]